MKAINITDFKWRSFAAALLLSLSIGLFGIVSQVSAHGGEDHGDAKPTAVSNQKGMVARTARAGDFEVLLKHAAIEPDAETAAKLFVTRFGTNEPFAEAKPAIEIAGKDGKTFEASEVKSDAPGSYSFKLPPLPEGSYTVLAKLNLVGKSDTATFSSVGVEHPAAESAAGTGSWARTALLALATVAVLGLLGGLMFFALRFAKTDRINEEAVSA